MTSVLIVEDDVRVRDFLTRGLKAEGYEVSVAADAQTGLDLALETAPDLMVLDVMLPSFSGLDLCRRVRGAGATVPILMLTALDATEAKVDGLRSGADDYLTKPFDFEELLARLEALTRRGRGAMAGRDVKLQVGDLVLDRDAMIVTDGEVPIELTRKEYELLEYLMIYSGKVTSRTRILNKVWGYSSDPLTNVVDVYIRRLRSKLDQGAGPSRIHTVRGYGYKLA